MNRRTFFAACAGAVVGAAVPKPATHPMLDGLSFVGGHMHPRQAVFYATVRRGTLLYVNRLPSMIRWDGCIAHYEKISTSPPTCERPSE